MRIVPVVLLLISAGISTVSAQEEPAPPVAAAQETSAPAPTPAPPTSSAPPFAMDHGQAAAAEAAAKAEAEEEKAKAAAIAAGTPLLPSQSTNFSVNSGDVIPVAPPPSSEQQKAAAQARDAWQARCRPTVVTDSDGLRRTRYAAPDCDISRLNTAKAQ
jgi:hypothetical protein